jgi:putative flippase GtrA
MFKKFFVEQTDNFLIQLFRATFVGGIATVVDFGILYFLTEKIKIYYIISAMVAFLFGLIVNYYLSIHWIFRTEKFDNKWVEFGVFGIIGIIGLGLNVFFIWIFTETYHLYYLISKILATVLVFAWNFIARKYLVFYSSDKGSKL